MAPASSRLVRDLDSSYFDSPERMHWLSRMTADSLANWGVRQLPKQCDWTLREILNLEEKYGFRTTRWSYNRIHGFQPINPSAGSFDCAVKKDEIPAHLADVKAHFDEDATWIFCKDGNERGMKEVPGEGREHTIIKEAVELLRKVLEPGSSPSEADDLHDHTTTHLEGNKTSSSRTLSIPSFPDFPYLNIPPGDTGPLSEPPAYSETDNLRAYTGPFEPITTATKPVLASPPPYSPSPSTDAFPINAVPKTKGKKGKKGKKKEKAERKASKMAAAATTTTTTTPAGPSTDEGLDQPQTPSSTSTVINTPVTGEMSSSPSAQQTPLTFEATLAASFAKVEATGEVVVNAESETLASLPAPQPLTFETTKTAPAVEVAVTGDVAVDVEFGMPQSLLAGSPLTFETTPAVFSAEVAVTGDVTSVEMEIAASPSAPPTTKPAEAATYADFDLTMCPAYPPYWHITCHGKSYFCWQREDGHMEPVDVATLERDDTVLSCLFYPPCTQHQPSKSCWCPECVGSLRFCCCYHYPQYCNYPFPPVPAPMEPWWAEQWRYEQQNLKAEDQRPVAKSQVLEPGKMSTAAFVPEGKKVEVVEPTSVLESVVAADKQPTPKPESVAESASRLTTPVESTRKKKKKKAKKKSGKKSSPPPPLPPYSYSARACHTRSEEDFGL
ncbi:uncharacterized protein N7503_001092 [Penicillium pulvis]|uniref:uncharacterized protein n=1 Tax=Penicillium pulvis TaxID=1562058 RepID=UPI0025486ECE|nr:uncharacterized protein N7503_001092 [Penicillium pulvis]KAJ5814342.1 hypothetical protein N7503_001092 [Penicillium pulvis]